METNSLEFSRKYRRALNLLARGQWEEALEPFSSLAITRPEDPGIQTALGWCLISAKRHHEAEFAFRRCLAIEPENVTALLGLITVLLRQGDYFEASGQVERALSLEPAHPELCLCRVATLLGTGRRKAATKLARRLIGKDDSALPGLLKLGLALFESGQFSHSKEMAEVCLSCRAHDAVSMALLGASMVRDGDALPGIEWLVMSLERDPELTFARRELDRAYRYHEESGAAGWVES